MQAAENGSHFFDPDEWTIDKVSFEGLTKGINILTDVFAHTSNAKSRRFFSYGCCPRSSGIDAFAQDWRDLVVWACPPIFLIIPTVRKICATRMSGILVEVSHVLDNFVSGRSSHNVAVLEDSKTSPACCAWAILLKPTYAGDKVVPLPCRYPCLSSIKNYSCLFILLPLCSGVSVSSLQGRRPPCDPEVKQFL